MKKLLVICSLILVSCTRFDDVKNGHDHAEVTQKTPVGQEVIEATWKDSGLWILTRKRKAGETIDTLDFNSYDGYEDSERPTTILHIIEQ